MVVSRPSVVIGYRGGTAWADGVSPIAKRRKIGRGWAPLQLSKRLLSLQRHAFFRRRLISGDERSGGIRPLTWPRPLHLWVLQNTT